MPQSRLESAIEVGANTLVGFGTAFIINWLVSVTYGVKIPTGENISIICVFTVWSWCRQFIIRRVFASTRLRAKCYWLWLRWQFRNEDDTICCCGGEEKYCGYGCLPAQFVSQKWYVIDLRMKERFGNGWNQYTTKGCKRRAAGHRDS